MDLDLPTPSEGPELPSVFGTDEPLKIALKIARGFIHNPFPMTAKGEVLKRRVGKALLDVIHETPKSLSQLQTLASKLPTVENPRLELFKDIETPKGVDWPLALPQTTKGCSHQCGFCAAQSSANITYMPFMGVLKLVEKIRTETRALLPDMTETVAEKLQAIFAATKTPFRNMIDCLNNEFKLFIGKESELHRFISLIEELKCKIVPYLVGFTSVKWVEGVMEASALFRGWDSGRDLPEAFFKMRAMFNFLARNSKYYAINFIMTDLGHFFSTDEHLESVLNTLCLRGFCFLNYFDSEPLDYRDFMLLHQDGTPAHYGDVVCAAGKAGFQTHITTAGWSKGSARGNAAAKALIANQHFLRRPRYSVNPTESLAAHAFEQTGSYAPYLENVMDNLRIFRKLNPVVSLRYIKDHAAYKKFADEVVAPLIRAIQGGELEGCEYKEDFISNYSSRDPSIPANSDEKVMDGFPGFFVWPDGSIHWKGGDDTTPGPSLGQAW